MDELAESLEIRPGRASDVPGAMQILKACIDAMRGEGIDQWDEGYPDRATLESDQAGGHLHVATIGGRCVGLVVVDDRQPEQYAAVAWQFRQGPFAVVHRLAVHPDFQSRGLGRFLMAGAEAVATGLGFRVVRLEALAANPAALGLYDTLGYARRGVVQFRNRDFICFEKSVG
ncbi:MAG: N-acetyltransferase family protein [Phycisphaerae bacterium]